MDVSEMKIHKYLDYFNYEIENFSNAAYILPEVFYETQFSICAFI